MKKKQWNGIEFLCASSAEPETWRQINWAKCEREVRKLQIRIAKALKQGRSVKLGKKEILAERRHTQLDIRSRRHG